MNPLTPRISTFFKIDPCFRFKLQPSASGCWASAGGTVLWATGAPSAVDCKNLRGRPAAQAADQAPAREDKQGVRPGDVTGGGSRRGPSSAKLHPLTPGKGAGGGG